MSISMNIHPGPDDKWKNVEATLYGYKEGSCINLLIGSHTISIHYGGESNRNEFIKRLKEEINKLPCD